MKSGPGSERDAGTGEIVVSEEEFRQSGKLVASALSSVIRSIYGSSAGAAVEGKIARGLDHKVDKGLLDEDSENFPMANLAFVERFLRELATGLREKS